MLLDRASNIEDLDALSVGGSRDRRGSHTEQLAHVVSEREALAGSLGLALLLAVCNRLDVGGLAQGGSVLVLACGCGGAGVALLLAARFGGLLLSSVDFVGSALLGAGFGVVGVGFVGAGLAGVGFASIGLVISAFLRASVGVRGRGCSFPRRVGSGRLHGWHVRTSLVKCDEVGAALARDLCCRDGEEEALDGAVNHAEDKRLALSVGCARRLASLRSLAVGRLGDGAMAAGSSWGGAAA